MLGLSVSSLAQDGRSARPAIKLRVGSSDAVVISKVEKGSSAEEAGLKVGDQLLRVDHINVVGMKPRKVAPMLRGLPGSLVRLTILPRMEMVPRVVEVVRDVQDSAPIGSESTSETLRRLAFTRAPKDADRRLQVDDITFELEAFDRETIVDHVHSRVDDIRQCAKAVENFPFSSDGKFTVRFSVKGNGYVGVRVEPVEIDVQVCIAAKVSHWRLPEPDTLPAAFVVVYAFPQLAQPVVTPDAVPEVSPEASPEATSEPTPQATPTVLPPAPKP